MTSKIIKLIQGTEEWHQHRALYRNASEAAAMLGLSPWMSQYQLWEVKTGRRRQEATYPMLRGIELEPAARTAYENYTGIIMQPVVMVNGEYSASLDGMSLPGDTILEVKCPMKGKDSETWKLAESGQVEHHYQLQIQQQLMVSEAKKCHFWVFNGKKGVMVEVRPNPTDVTILKAGWDTFMKFVVTDTPPPLTALDTVYRNDDTWRAAAEAYIARKSAVEVALAKAEEAKTELVELAQHSSERGYGVSVCRFWKGRMNSKEEVRVTLTKQERQPC